MKRLLLLLVVVLALAGLAGTVASKASAGTVYCNMWNIGQSCSTNYNYWRVHTVHNGSTSNAIIYCISWHPDGSLAGAYGTVYPGQWRDFWAGGYSKMTCSFTSGQGGFPIAIYSYT